MNGVEPLPALPYRLGRIGWRSALLGALALIGLAIGLVAYSQQLCRGFVVTGLRTIGQGGATWGLYIAFDIFFIGVSFAGITVALLTRLFAIEAIRPLARMAELLTIVALLTGALCVLADLGRPLEGLLDLPRYARTTSPFFGTFSLVLGGYLFASLVYFYLAGREDAASCAARPGPLRWLHRLWASGWRGTDGERRRHRRVSFWLALAILPLLVIAHSTLGFIFGIQSGRPGWFSALQAPGFVVMAGVSGTGLLIVIAAAARRSLRLHGTIRPAAFAWLSNFLLVLVAVYLYFMVVEELTAHYASYEADTRVAEEVVAGAYSRSFWTVVASLLAALAILFAQYVRSTVSIRAAVVAGLLVNVAAVVKRLLIVVPSQTHGMLLPYDPGSYAPTWVELGVVGALFCLGTLLYLAFTAVFPLVPIARGAGREEPGEGGEGADGEPRGRRMLRLALFVASLLGGIALAGLGFWHSAGIGREPWVDPKIPFAPVLFILGVMLSFYSAAIYETLPPPRPAPPPDSPPQGPARLSAIREGAATAARSHGVLDARRIAD
jgi:molybdopterin-containing oxidoreductase family membrane subunit